MIFINTFIGFFHTETGDEIKSTIFPSDLYKNTIKINIML